MHAAETLHQLGYRGLRAARALNQDLLQIHGRTGGDGSHATLVAVAGGREAGNVDAICTALDRVKERHPDMVLVHGGGPGAGHIAARWAESNAVHQVVFRPDWDAHGRAAPFRRNDQLLKLLPTGLVAFPGAGITENLVDKARELGIPVFRVDA